MKTPYELNCKGRLQIAADYDLRVKPVVVVLTRRGGAMRHGAVSAAWIVERMTAAGLAPASHWRARLLAEGAILAHGDVVGLRAIMLVKPEGFKSYILDTNGWRATA